MDTNLDIEEVKLPDESTKKSKQLDIFETLPLDIGESIIIEWGIIELIPIIIERKKKI